MKQILAIDEGNSPAPAGFRGHVCPRKK
jgi:hypothetical protein